MRTTDQTVPAWPTIAVIVREDGSGEVNLNGTSHPITATSLDSARNEALAFVAHTAQQLGRPVHATAHGPDGEWALIVDTDGTVHENAASPKPSPPLATPAPTAATPQEAPEPHSATAASAPIAHQSSPVVTSRPSFLRQTIIERPAVQGWRGALSRVGIRIAPSAKELAERSDVRTVSQHWPGPRTLSVLNGKGGVGKTMTTISLAATFARNGGSGVLAWDNNQTRGTLGWSTEQGPHAGTILDLLPRVSEFLGPRAQGSDLANHVHHQTSDKFDVLRSKPELLATEQRFDGTTVDAIHEVASKFYRLIIVDSGNDETDPMWVRAVELSSAIVVPTIVEAKAAESAALLLESLAARGGHFATLAANAVVIVSAHKHDLPAREINAMAENFTGLARQVVTIPYDAALGADMLHFDNMQPRTQRAWLAATAAIARGF